DIAPPAARAGLHLPEFVLHEIEARPSRMTICGRRPFFERQTGPFHLFAPARVVHHDLLIFGSLHSRRRRLSHTNLPHEDSRHSQLGRVARFDHGRIDWHYGDLESHPHKIARENTALAANGSLRRMYLPTSASETWPVCALIRQAGAPARAALVTKPARSECPEYRVGSRPIALTRCFTMDAMESPESRLGSTCPRRVSGLNTGPSLIPDSSSHPSSAFTGQIAFRPRGMATWRAWPSWSVLLFGMVMMSPLADRSIHLQSTALSSERRNAPAKPMSSRA